MSQHFKVSGLFTFIELVFSLWTYETVQKSGKGVYLIDLRIKRQYVGKIKTLGEKHRVSDLVRSGETVRWPARRVTDLPDYK